MLPCKAVLTRKITETRRERSVLSCTCLLSCLSSTSEDENSGLLVYLSYLYISAWKKNENTTPENGAQIKQQLRKICLWQFALSHARDTRRNSFVCLCTCHQGADWLFKEILRIHLNLWQSSSGWFFFFTKEKMKLPLCFLLSCNLVLIAGYNSFRRSLETLGKKQYQVQHGLCSYTFLLPEMDNCRSSSTTPYVSNAVQRDAPLEYDDSIQRLQLLENMLENNTQWLMKVTKSIFSANVLFFFFIVE